MAVVKIPLSPGGIVPRDMNARQFSTWLQEQSAQSIRAGATGYDAGTGIWFGQDTDGSVKMFVGESAGHKITWDGATLTVVGDITVEDGSITAPKLAAGSVTADKIDVSELSAISADLGAITAGNIVLSEFIRSGQTAFDTGTGFWLGKDSGTPKFSIGDSAGARLTWDGSTLAIHDADGADKTVEHLFFKGDSDTHPAIGQLLGSAVVTVNGAVAGDVWQALRTITTDFTGSFRLRIEARRVDTLGAPPSDGSWRIKDGAGVVQDSETFSSTVYADTFTVELTVTSPGEVWTLEGLTSTDLSTWTLDTQIRDIEVRARPNHATIA